MNAAVAIQPQFQVYTPTFSDDLFSRFIDYTDRKDTTVKGYLTCIRQFAKWLDMGGITQPTRDDVKAYRDDLAERGLTAGTQSQYLRAVKHFFKWTAAEGLYPNIADNIHGAKVRHDVHKRDALERDDVAKIADTIDRTTETGKRDYAIYMLCITGGLRCVEVHRADICDLKTVGGRTYLYIQGKGHDDKDAPVLIIPEVKDALDDYLDARTDRITAKSPLFVSTSNNSKGQRIAATTISSMIKKVLINAGYDSDRLTAHSLRHTSGTGAYKATGNIYLAQKHQRHVSPETTEIYVHAEDRAERITEQQVYNYYFRNEDGDRLDTARRILDTLSPEQLDKVINYMNTL